MIQTTAEMIQAQAAERSARELASRIRNLIFSLDREATRIEEALAEGGRGVLACSPNSLGVIQGSGPQIDVLCGKLAAQLESLTWIQRIDGAEEA